MQPRISLITLDAAEIPPARAFYERLGWKVVHNPFFPLDGAGNLVLPG